MFAVCDIGAQQRWGRGGRPWPPRPYCKRNIAFRAANGRRVTQQSRAYSERVRCRRQHLPARLADPTFEQADPVTIDPDGHGWQAAGDRQSRRFM